MLVAQLGYVPGRNTPAYYAAIYLLTSNEVVYWRTANCFCNGGLDFQYVFFRGITTYNDALQGTWHSNCSSKALTQL